MKRRLTARAPVLATAAAAALLGGCLGGGLPPIHYYTLAPPAEAARAGAAGEPGQGLAVGVDSFAVDPPYDQDRLVYRRGTHSTEVGFYSFHRWASPLGRLVAVALAGGLRGAAGIASIEPASSSGDYDARLGGRVLYLEEVGPEQDRQVRMAVELVLRNEDGETLWSAKLSASQPGGADSPAGPTRTFAVLLGEARAGLEAALGAGGGS